MWEGTFDGCAVGDRLGWAEGTRVGGEVVGVGVGAKDGYTEGCFDGATVRVGILEG